MSSGGSEWASERTNDCCLACEQSEQCGASERVSGVSERANGRASGPELQSVFLVILAHSAPSVPGRHPIIALFMMLPSAFPRPSSFASRSLRRHTFRTLSFSNIFPPLLNSSLTISKSPSFWYFTFTCFKTSYQWIIESHQHVLVAIGPFVFKHYRTHIPWSFFAPSSLRHHHLYHFLHAGRLGFIQSRCSWIIITHNIHRSLRHHPLWSLSPISDVLHRSLRHDIVSPL